MIQKSKCPASRNDCRQQSTSGHEECVTAVRKIGPGRFEPSIGIVESTVSEKKTSAVELQHVQQHRNEGTRAQDYCDHVSCALAE